MRYRKILRLGKTQKVTNEALYKKIQLKENLLQKATTKEIKVV